MRELTLEELRLVADLTWPSIQSDIDANQVDEIAEVEVFVVEEPLFSGASHYAYRRSTNGEPKPLAAGVRALPGRHRAWVLPLSGVGVAFEPLDDELAYLRAHRRQLFTLQEVDDAALVPLTELRRGEAREFGLAPLNDLFAMYGWLRNRLTRGYYEGLFAIPRHHQRPYEDPFTACIGARPYLVPGTLYRIRPTKTWRRVVEVVVPVEERETVGPYR